MDLIYGSYSNQWKERKIKWKERFEHTMGNTRVNFNLMTDLIILKVLLTFLANGVGE